MIYDVTPEVFIIEHKKAMTGNLTKIELSVQVLERDEFVSLYFDNGFQLYCTHVLRDEAFRTYMMNFNKQVRVLSKPYYNVKLGGLSIIQNGE